MCLEIQLCLPSASCCVAVIVASPVISQVYAGVSMGGRLLLPLLPCRFCVDMGSSEDAAGLLGKDSDRLKTNEFKRRSLIVVFSV